MNVGIIGCGLMGRQRARSLALLPNPPLVEAVYDPSPESANALAKTLGCVTAQSLTELLERPGIGVVIAAVPHWAAKDTVLTALEAGKHVICEKPLGVSARDAEEVVLAVQRSGLQLTPGFNYRYYPGFRAAAQAVQSGRIGRLTHIRCELGHGARPGYDREWKTSKALCGGGSLLDPGIHIIDLIRYIAGEIRFASGILFRSFWNIDVEDNAFVHLETENGCMVQLHISITEWCNRCALDLCGDEGCITVRGRSGFYGAQTMRVKKRWDWLEAGSTETCETFPADELSFAEEMQAFWRRLDGLEAPDLATAEDGNRAMEIIEHIYSFSPIQDRKEREWRELSRGTPWSNLTLVAPVERRTNGAVEPTNLISRP